MWFQGEAIQVAGDYAGDRVLVFGRGIDAIETIDAIDIIEPIWAGYSLFVFFISF